MQPIIGSRRTCPRRDSLFAWLLDPGHVCGGLVAETDDGLVGLAHYRSMPSPLRGAEVGFLDDLFVDPERRGLGAGEALLLAVDGIAAERGMAGGALDHTRQQLPGARPL